MESEDLQETLRAECELFRSCRVGDLEKVRYLVECNTVELNLRDTWDSTPLYYACLCGHEDIVEYLLINGAKCEANTFDGERCLYAAINDRIRKVLRTYKAITSECMRRDSYREWLRRCLSDNTFADICFVVHGCSLFAHRVILGARSRYFNSMFLTKWKGKSAVRLNHPLVKPWAFKAILQYLYTDRVDIDVEKVEDCILLAKQCKLPQLKNRLEMRLREMETFSTQKPGTNTIKVMTIEPQSGATSLYDAFSAVTEQVTTPVLQKSSTEWESPEDFLRSFLLAMPPEEEQQVGSESDRPLYADVCFEVEEYIFYGHKVFFCGRSDYFKALLSDYFAERVPRERCQDNEEIPTFRLNNVSPQVFADVVSYIYQNTTELSEETVYNVMCMADLYLITGLKQLCANKIRQLLDVDNVIPILRASRLFGLGRLEADCCQFIATVLEKVVEKDEFAQLVLEDATGIIAREETDSIPVIDDIRFHLYNTALPTAELEELDAAAKLEVLSNFLLKLGLDC